MASAGIEAAGAPRLLERAAGAAATARLLSSRPLSLIAAGKAAGPMAAVFAQHHAHRLRRGLVVGTHRDEPWPSTLEWIRGGHPVPDAASDAAGRAALQLAGEVSADERLVVLLSGGASALLALPAQGIDLDAKQAVTRQLLRAGADIHAMNAVRKHLSRIKGGQLAAASRGPTLTLAVSDVLGDDLSVIGSGPTVADPSTFRDALGVLERHGGLDAYPGAVVDVLREGAEGGRAETPKPGDPRLSSSLAKVIGSRQDVLEGAAHAAEALGYAVVVLPEPVAGEARLAGRDHVRRMIERAAALGGRACVLSGGETTVIVRGSGRGGRNQEFALAAAGLVAACGGAVLVSIGTDGVDGPTDAAGAVVDHTTVGRALAQKMAPDAYLDENDSYAFFEQLGDLVRTGPTLTNVGDLQVLLVEGA